MIKVFLYKCDVHTQKITILRKTNYIQRNLNDKRSTRYKRLYETFEQLNNWKIWSKVIVKMMFCQMDS